jgi:ATP-dependent helicase/nuclease subunit B
MAVTRTLMGWDGPPLELACAWLLNRASDGDFSKLLVVTPGARGGRLLLGLLVDRAAEQGIALSPPTFLTPGEVAGAVLKPRGRVASRVHMRIAWARAIEACEELDVLIPHRRGADDHGLLALAAVLASAHEELIGEGLRFEDVPGRIAAMEDREVARWHAAAAAQRRYEAELASIGMVDDGLARVQALASPQTVGVRMVLVGVPELNEVARRSLALPGVEAESLVFAPPELSGLFDEWGCPRTNEWRSRPIPVGDEDIMFSDGPEDQGRCVAEVMARLGGAYSVHDITVGVPDETVTGHVVRAAERYAGVEARPAAGSLLLRSSIFQLMSAIGRLLEENTFEALTALVRHPDVERRLLRSSRHGPIENWLARMDEYSRRHLPHALKLDGPMPGADEVTLQRLSEVQRKMRSYLEPLLGERVAPGDLLSVMQRLYFGARVGRNDPAGRDTIRASQALQRAAADIAGLPEAWQPRTGASLIRLILDSCGSERLPAESTTDALELLGWLELPLDTAPVTIVTGVNDGAIPETYGADPLLPDSLREKLGLACSERRLARDAYLMTLLVQSRRELKLICGRRGAEGDPLLPSRLLFAADSRTVVKRIRRFCDERQEGRGRLVPRFTHDGADRFPVMPHVKELARITSMRVTSFRTYIASPYLFYLQSALKLEEVDRAGPELDALSFGSFIHEVLEDFAGCDARESTSETSIRECLLDLLSTRARAQFGPEPALALHIQLELARLRLSEFAAHQAKWRREGWIIDRREWKPEGGAAPLPGAAEPFMLRGKIDRIDRNEDGRVAILDYKTGESAANPKQHRSGGRWVDLQLPLYRHLAAELKLPEDPSRLLLGYVAIPGRAGVEQFAMAEWTQAELDDADATARDIANRVLSGDFLRLGDAPPQQGTFAALSGTALAASAREGCAP